MYTQKIARRKWWNKGQITRRDGRALSKFYKKKLNDIGHKSFGIESEVNTWTSRVTWIETRQQTTDVNGEIATFYDQLT